MQLVCLLSATAAAASAQLPTGDPLPGLAPTHSLLQMIGTDASAWVNGQTISGPGDYLLQFNAMPGVTLRRSFQEKVTDTAGAALDIGRIGTTLDELAFEAGARTSLHFSREQSEVRDIGESLLSGREVRTLGLTQGFGSGGTAGSLSFNREEVHSLTPGGQEDSAITQLMALETGLVGGVGLKASFQEQHQGKISGWRKTQMSTGLSAPFAGGAAALSFARSTGTEGTHSEESTTEDFTAPLQLFGGRASFQTTLTDSQTDAARARVKSMKFSSPLPLSGGQLALEMTDWSHNQTTGLQGDRLAGSFSLPLLGNKWAVSYDRLLQAQDGHSKQHRGLELSLPLALFGQQALLERKVDLTGADAAWTGSSRTHLALPLAALQPGASYDYLQELSAQPGTQLESRTAKFLLPLHQLDDRATLEIVDSAHTNNGAYDRTRTTRLFTPLERLAAGATFEYLIVGQMIGAQERGSRTATVALPLKLGGAPSGVTYQSISTDQGDTTENQQIVGLSATLGGQSLRLFEQKMIDTVTAGQPQHQQITFLQGPPVKFLGGRASLLASQLRNTTDPGDLTTTTEVTLNAQPLKPCTLSAKVRTVESGDSSVETARILSKLALSATLGLEAQMEATAPSDAASTIRRSFFVTRTGKGSGLELRAGWTSWSQPGGAPAPAGLLQVGMGNPAKVRVEAQYAEYDPGSWTRLAEPSLKLGVSRGDPAHLSVRVEYEDSPARAALGRRIELAMPALGGALKLGFVQNPIIEGGTLRPVQQYELGLSRKLFGGLTLEAGYRYLDFLETPTTPGEAQNIKLLLAGGTPEHGGQISLAYLSGEFVGPIATNLSLPESTLKLTFSRQWRGDGRLTLSLERSTAPLTQPTVGDCTEGRMEYNASFW